MHDFKQHQKFMNFHFKSSSLLFGIGSKSSRVWNKTTGIPIKSDSKVGSTKSIPTALSRTVLNALFHYLLSDKKNVEALVAQLTFSRENVLFLSGLPFWTCVVVDFQVFWRTKLRLPNLFDKHNKKELLTPFLALLNKKPRDSIFLDWNALFVIAG